MVSGAEMEMIVVHLPARAWATADACVGLASQDAVGADDYQKADFGDQIKSDAGLQIPWNDGAWPPDEQVIAIALTRAQWRFVLNELAANIPLLEDLGQTEDVTLVEQAIEVIRPQV
jgi:hypothetical protein